MSLVSACQVAKCLQGIATSTRIFLKFKKISGKVFVKYRDHKVRQRRITKCDWFKDYKVRHSWVTNYDRFWITKCDKNSQN